MVELQGLTGNHKKPLESDVKVFERDKLDILQKDKEGSE